MREGAGSAPSVRCVDKRRLFGRVVQGEARPTLGEGNAFEGNTEQDQLFGGDLPVPNTPSPLP